VIPFSAYRYRAEERKTARAAKAQKSKGIAPEEPPARSEDHVIRLRTKP
jgi:hypothetical protein